MNQTSGSFKILDQYINERIDSFLKSKIPDLSRNIISNLIIQGDVFVNGIAVKKSYKLKLGDVVTITVPPPKISNITPQDINLNIVYEDSSIIVINKPQNMVVHPGAGNFEGTIVNGLLYHCDDLKGVGDTIRPGVVHRIDKDTTGLLVFAKDNYSLNFIADQFKEHSNKREYNAIVWGNLDKEGVIENFLSRDPNNRLKFTGKYPKGKKAITFFKTIKKFSHFSILSLKLKTGRTHQIRVHLSEMGHPIIGDPLYNYGIKHYSFLPIEVYQKIKQLKGQMLHAKTLGFIHPETKKYIEFTTNPHKDFLDFETILDHYDL